MTSKNRAIASQIAIMILALLAFGILYVALNEGISLEETFQTTNFGSGVFNPVSYLTWVEQMWIWLPLIVVIFVIYWLIRQAQRRSNPIEELAE